MVPDAPNWFFSTLAFIGFMLCMIPLPWHLEAWNTGTCLYMIWTGLACLNQFINSVVWNSDVRNKAPLWCDISSKFIVGSAVAIPAASLCINRRLYHIASVRTATKTRAQKRRDVMIDLAIGLGIPLLEMILHIVVQAHRFVIFEEVGCYPFTSNTPLTYVLVNAWPVAIGLVSACYCIPTIRKFAFQRAQFKEFLSTNKNLSSSLYLRLMGLAGVEILCTVPLGSYSIYLNATSGPVEAYVSWDNAHAGFNEIQQVPSAVWHQDQEVVVSIELSRYLVVFCAVVFFAFFGLADEAKKNYRLAYMSIAKRVGFFIRSTSEPALTWTIDGSTNSDMSYSGRSAIIPVFVTHQTEQRQDSFPSFSPRMLAADLGGALGDLEDPFSHTATSSASMSKELLVGGNSLPLFTLPAAGRFDVRASPQYLPDVPRAPVGNVIAP